MESPSIPISAADMSPSVVSIAGLPQTEKQPDSAPHRLENISLEDLDSVVNPQSWRYPRSNLLKLLATFWSFVVIGANDGVYGAVIPSLEVYYGLTYTTVSLIFLSPVFGYVTAAFTNNFIHLKFGQRGLAIITASCHIIAYVVVCIHPPFPALVVVYMLSGYGNGLGDAGWNAWLGDFDNVNEIMGILHGCYGLGAMLSPLIATSVISRLGWKWYQYYYILVGAALLELIVLTSTFWTATAAEYRSKHLQEIPGQNSGPASSTGLNSDGSIPNILVRDKQPKSRSTFIQRIEHRWKSSMTIMALKNKITWICSIFLLIYMGIEVSLGGWTVTFMLNVRHGSEFRSGLATTGFWAGLTAGRMVLGFVTGNFFPSPRIALIVYLSLATAFQLIFWLVPHFVASAISVAFIGFFIGPAFPAIVVEAMKLLPTYLHVSGVGFASAFCGIGATVFPFAVGAIAQQKGVEVLMPIVLSLLAACLSMWIFVFR
ncbi:hypothetical protein BP5796_09295 [Coleophoma crateriformis]|uniref:Major facilitator superfamily (MFS) profile domain-containing protein n=1 Tax=Coleophoma crateriformis TaxID=565419 RepID=A0A3D8R3V8_9HELO|nr:hypothetical protein BP5796_09295 [Coleophoma crateriformis]